MFDNIPEKEGLTYLASPYSVIWNISKSMAARVRRRRFEEVCKKAADMMKEGFNVFCPIAHSHPIEVIGMPGELQSGDFWMKQDLEVLRHCSRLVVFRMEGWNESSGVKREIAFAEENNIPVYYIDGVQKSKLLSNWGEKDSVLEEAA